MLFKNFIRTFLKYKVQFISMIIMIFLGIGIFSGFNSEWYSIKKNTDKFFTESNLADYRIYITDDMKSSYAGFSNDDLLKIKSNKDVIDASLVTILNTIESKEEDIVKLCVTTNPNVTSPITIKGKNYNDLSDNGILLSSNYAELNNYNIGDEITLSYGDIITNTFIIEGIAQSSEFMINTDGVSMMPDYDKVGYSFINKECYERIMPYDFYTQINVKTNLDADNLSIIVDETLNNTFEILDKNNLLSYDEAKREANEGKAMAFIIPFIFLLITVLTLISTMTRLIENERLEIGILKELGFKNKRILRGYLLFSLLISIIGSVLGLGLGYLVTYFIFRKDGSLGEYFEMPYWKIYIPWFTYLSIILMILLLIIITYLSIYKIVNGTVIETLNGESNKKGFKGSSKLFDKLSFTLRYDLRDILRHIPRTLSTIIGVMGCTLLLIASFSFLSTMSSFKDTYYNTQLNYESKITLSSSTSNKDAINLANDYNGDYSSTLSIKIKSDSYTLDIFNDENKKYVLLNDDYKKIEEVSSDGCYICKRIQEKYNLNVNDYLIFSIYGSSKAYKIKIIGIVYSLPEGIFITTDCAYKLGIEYQINNIYTDALKENINSNSYIELINTKSDIIESFNSFMEIMDEMVILLVLFSLVLAFIVLYNLESLSFNEKRKELSTLKVLGFNNNKIIKIMLVETISLLIIGIILGIPFGMSSMKMLVKRLASNYELKITFEPYVFIFTIILILAVSIVSNYFVSSKIKKIDMVESLKKE